MTNTLPGGPTAAGDEFSADTDQLGLFVERGQTYVENVEHIANMVANKRGPVAAALGAGIGPVDNTTSRLQELVAEAALNNAYVSQIRDSLLQRTAQGQTLTTISGRLDQDLRTNGLLLDGTDLDGTEDQLRLEQFRTTALRTAGIGPTATGDLVQDSAAYRSALTLLNGGAHPEAVGSASFNRLRMVADFQQRAAAVAAVAVPDFKTSDVAARTAEHLDALLTGAYAQPLHTQVLAGTVPPPTDAIRDQVANAMAAGLSPGEVGLAAAYFPVHYRRFLDLSEEIESAEARREVADGSSWKWWDSDETALAAVDAELADLRDEQRALKREHQIGGDGHVGTFVAAAAIGAATGGLRWEGQIYGNHFIGFHDTKISGGGILGGGKGAIKDPSGNDVELRHIGERVDSAPEVAVAFYDAIGVERTSNLATFLVGNDLTEDEFAWFAAGLAAASRVTTAGRRAVLSFSGAELMEHPKPPTQDGVIWYNPATLFAAGDFDRRFLVDAAGATLALAEAGNGQGLLSHVGWASAGHGVTAAYDGGEDPRNILIARVAESPDATRALLFKLGGPRGRGWPGSPRVGSLDQLLKPNTPFQPTIGPDSEPYWLDELLSNRISDPNHHAVDTLGYPALSSDYPITALLTAASTDPELSRWILRYVADAVRTDGPMPRDPGTAAGLDMVLAHHATLVFEPSDLAAVGISPTPLNDDDQAPISAEHWRTVYGEVLRLGRGQALALANEQLLDRAIVGAVDRDGWFSADLTAPFAQVAGRTETEAFSALIAYSAQLDKEARDKNRWANLALSAAVGVAGVIPYVGPVASASSTTWNWFFNGYPTDAELSARRERDAEELLADDLMHWKELVAEASLEARLGSSDNRPPQMEANVSGDRMQLVSIRRAKADEPVGIRWQHPETGVWRRVPSPSDGNAFYELFGAAKDLAPGHGVVVAEASRVDQSYRDGLLVAVDGGAGRRYLLGEEGETGSSAVATAPYLEQWHVMEARAEAGWTDAWLGDGQS